MIIIIPTIIADTTTSYNATLTTATVYFAQPGATEKYMIEMGINDTLHGLAVGSYAENIQGWDKIWVRALKQINGGSSANLDAVEAMGFFEGYMSQKRIYSLSQNNYADWFEDNKPSSPTHVYDWLIKNHNWVKDQASKKLAKYKGTNITTKTKEYKYWWSVSLFIRQFDGIMLGYNSIAPAKEKLSLEQFLLLNADGDVESIIDLPDLKEKMKGMNITLKSVKKKKNTRCSAIFKLDPVVREIYFGHTTWDNFDMSAIRQLKSYQYDFIESYNGDPYVVAMSSSPGFLSSVDDFYLSSNRLAIIETTNGIYNKKLWDKVTTSSVLSWMRVNIANMLSSTTTDWTETFCLENSGTYNNQWMILDIVKVEQYQYDRNMKSLLPETFKVLEQIPGTCTVKDESNTLSDEKYWASYNIPAFSNIWTASGFGDGRPKYEFSHSDCPRAKIFADRFDLVEDLHSLQTLLRYNDYQTDKISKGNPCNAISARCDLNRINSTNFFLEGGIDSKATTASLAKRMLFTAQQGPTHDQQAPFSWLDVEKEWPFKKYEQIPKHIGAPDVYNFNWTEFSNEIKL